MAQDIRMSQFSPAAALTGDEFLIALQLGDNARISLSQLLTFLGPNYQAADEDLSLIAALTTNAFGRSLLTAIDQPAARTLLALGTMATQNANAVALTGAPTAPTAVPGTNTTQIATTAFIQAAVAALVASSPAALDTLNELAAALGNDANFATTVNALIADRLARAGDQLTGSLGLAPVVNVASAATANIGAAASNLVAITGVTTITSLGVKAAGYWSIVRFAGVLTLTHNAASLILPGVANIQTAAGDSALFVSEGGGNWRCLWFSQAQLAPINLGAWTTYVPIVTTATPAGSGFTYTVNSARYLKIGRLVFVNAWVTLTNLGTGPAASGTTNISMPFQAAQPATGQGTESAISGHMVQGNMSAGSNLLICKKYDGTTTTVLNAQIRASIVFESNS